MTAHHHTGRHVRPDPRYAMVYQPAPAPSSGGIDPHPLIQGMIQTIAVAFALSAVMLLWLDGALMLVVLLRIVLWGHL